MVQLDEKSVALQLLYEKWVTREHWSLEESACLLKGQAPGDSSRDQEVIQLEAELVNAVDCGEMENLATGGINPENYEFEPQKVFNWASRRDIELPAELVNLMEFIIKTTAFAAPNELDDDSDSSIADSNDRERILGACVSVLANYPEECLNKKGKVSTERMLKLIDKYSDQLFSDELPGLSSTGIRDLVKLWVLKLEH